VETLSELLVPLKANALHFVGRDQPTWYKILQLRPDNVYLMSLKELQHRIWYIVFNGGLYLSPLEKDKLKNVLDIGCGTGG